MKAFGFDVDALTKSITHPFVNILEQFNTQMNQLHAEVKTTNKLLKDIKTTMTEGKDEEV